VFSEGVEEDDDDETLWKDGRSGMSTIREFPAPDREGHPLSVPESPGQPALTEAASGCEAGGLGHSRGPCPGSNMLAAGRDRIGVPSRDSHHAVAAENGR
jgi:hypothetical protein